MIARPLGPYGQASTQIRQLVATAPTLTFEQVDRLARVFGCQPPPRPVQKRVA